MNKENKTPGPNDVALNDSTNTSAPDHKNTNPLDRMQEAEEQQAGHAQVDTGITESDRNNFDEEHHQDTKKGAGHM